MENKLKNNYIPIMVNLFIYANIKRITDYKMKTKSTKYKMISKTIFIITNVWKGSNLFGALFNSYERCI